LIKQNHNHQQDTLSPQQRLQRSEYIREQAINVMQWMQEFNPKSISSGGELKLPLQLQ